MTKTILITGATDGIGLETAKMLAGEGHTLLLHGRSQDKLDATVKALDGATSVETYLADLSNLAEVETLAKAISDKHASLDILINNAGVLKTPNPITDSGLDIRFMVNTIAPYLLTKRLLPLMSGTGRIVNLSSAAQAPVNNDALHGKAKLSDMEAYSQSKLAITMWSRGMADALPDGPAVIAVNPGSLLASKMVKEGFGVEGSDLSIGADILRRAALSDEFATASGKYYDNDSHQFATPPPDAQNPQKCADLMRELDAMIA